MLWGLDKAWPAGDQHGSTRYGNDMKRQGCCLQIMIDGARGWCTADLWYLILFFLCEQEFQRCFCLGQECSNSQDFLRTFTHWSYDTFTPMPSSFGFRMKGWTSISQRFWDDSGRWKCQKACQLQEPHDVRGGDFPDPGKAHGWAGTPRTPGSYVLSPETCWISILMSCTQFGNLHSIFKYII